jgi:hypothetical protein
MIDNKLTIAKATPKSRRRIDFPEYRQGIVAAQIGPPEVVSCRLGDVRFGSKADIGGCPSDVRFTPKSGHGGRS